MPEPSNLVLLCIGLIALFVLGKLSAGHSGISG